MLVSKASRTLKMMIITHFQWFSRWPGAPKMDPEGRPNYIFVISFFVPGPNEIQREPRRCPREPKRGPGVTKGDPKGVQGKPREDPKRIQRNPKGVQGKPREGTVAGRPQAIGYFW